MIARLLRRLLRRPRADAPQDVAAQDAETVRRLRALGMRIGEGCRIYTTHVSTEPWLVTLGHRVGVAGGVKFLTHDGAAVLLRGRRPMAQSLGPIVVGDDCFIGEDAILLPGTRLGRGCIVGAGAVVRGEIAENSLVIGNPGKVVGRASLLIERMDRAASTLDTLGLPEAERRAVILRHFSLAEDADGG